MDGADERVNASNQPLIGLNEIHDPLAGQRGRDPAMIELRLCNQLLHTK